MIKQNRDIFSIETENTGYYISKRGTLIEKLHYGKKIHPEREALTEKIDAGYGTDVVYKEGYGRDSLIHLPLELSPEGKGDFREGFISISGKNGYINDWKYKGARILEKYEHHGDMPHPHNGGQVLELTFEAESLETHLLYETYDECDVILRKTVIVNNSEEDVVINRAMTFQTDLYDEGYTLSTFNGAWARERSETVRKIDTGLTVFKSSSGVSSQYTNPFFMVYENDATLNFGECFGFNLIYSGNHMGSVEAGPFRKIRIMQGINPEGFRWILKSGESFETPSALLSWSDKGKNGISHNFHKFINQHIISENFKDTERPVLINSWEASYFRFRQGDLLRLAKQAKDLGIELFVLDDGWFKGRDSDTKALGDYETDKTKLPDGLKGLRDKLQGIGLKMGLWVEPEMVSPDSDLYRAHSDWAVKAENIEPSLGRNQLVLDLCRKEVQDYIIENVNRTIKESGISYIKWDMNRHLTDPYSSSLTEQGMFHHTWIKGLYRILKEITEANPDVLFESCASGGNRTDLGMLMFMPQVWISDDTDAYERMKIQTGTLMGYPQSVMGCHVSASPNHQTLRRTPLDTRFNVASFGLLGYELDLRNLTGQEKKIIKDQISVYKKYRKLLQYGELTILKSPFDDPERCVWQIVSDDRKTAIVMDGYGRVVPNQENHKIRLKGLDPDRKYKVVTQRQKINIRDFGSLINFVLPFKVNSSGLLIHAASDHYMMETEEESHEVYGDLLMNAGIRNKQNFSGTGYEKDTRFFKDFSSRLYIIESVD